jgi:hypothetical protein
MLFVIKVDFCIYEFFIKKAFLEIILFLFIELNVVK